MDLFIETHRIEILYSIASTMIIWLIVVSICTTLARNSGYSEIHSRKHLIRYNLVCLLAWLIPIVCIVGLGIIAPAPPGDIYPPSYFIGLAGIILLGTCGMMLYFLVKIIKAQAHKGLVYCTHKFHPPQVGEFIQNVLNQKEIKFEVVTKRESFLPKVSFQIEDITIHTQRWIFGSEIYVSLQKENEALWTEILEDLRTELKSDSNKN